MAHSPSTGKPVIVLDATAIPKNRGGVGRYVDAVVPELAKRNDVTIVVVCQARDREIFEAVDGIRVIGLPDGLVSIPRRMLWEQFGLPGIAKREKAAAIYSPHYTFPLFTRTPRVVSIYDLTFFSHPELHSRLKRFFFRTWIRLSKLVKTTVVTSSHATQDELVRILRMPRQQITVAHLAYDTSVFHPVTKEEVEGFRSTLSPSVTSWVAFLGTLEPRKNVPALIAGFAEATENMSERPALLLSGADGWDENVAPAIVAARAQGVDVRKLGYLPLEQLRALLGGAEIVAYPSLGEGFGLPVLEAMASGACVLTTRELSLPEVGGDAVAYTGVSAREIGTVLARLLGDENERHELSAAAVERAQGFTWRATAEQLAGAFRLAARP